MDALLSRCSVVKQRNDDSFELQNNIPDWINVSRNILSPIFALPIQYRVFPSFLTASLLPSPALSLALTKHKSLQKDKDPIAIMSLSLATIVTYFVVIGVLDDAQN